MGSLCPLSPPGQRPPAAPPPRRLLALEEMVATHKKHVMKLELALRCLDNDQISPEEVDALRDELDYYLVGGGGVAHA